MQSREHSTGRQRETRIRFFGVEVRPRQMMEAIEAHEALERACDAPAFKTTRAIKTQNRARLAAGAKRQRMIGELYPEEYPAWEAWRRATVDAREAGKAVLTDLP